MSKFNKVAVLMGGFSSEREVSLMSGREIVAALQSKDIDAHAFDPAQHPLSTLPENGFQAAFNILHGTYGEDGVVQGALEALGVPYTGSGVLASAIAMDKFRTRLVWAGLGLPNVPYMVLHDDSDFSAAESELGLPLFAKPAAEGSSVGVVKVRQAGELAREYRQLKQYHGAILAEKNMVGGEYACAVLNGRALPSVKIIPATEFYDYEAKYFRDDTVYQCPSDLTPEQEKHMGDIAVAAFNALDCRTWARVDFLRDENGQMYLLEINTVPGMTTHSLVPRAASRAGLSFADLCVEVLNHATVG